MLFRSGDKVLHLGRVGEVGVVLGDVDVVLDAGQLAQLRLYHNPLIVGVLHHLAGEGHVVLVVVVAAIDHHRGKAPVDAGFADFKIRAVVQMQGDGQAGIGNGGLHQLGEVDMLGVLAGAGGNLEDDGGLLLGGGLGDALDDLHVVHIEGADGVATLIGFFEHLGSSDKRHNGSLLTQKNSSRSRGLLQSYFTSNSRKMQDA